MNHPSRKPPPEDKSSKSLWDHLPSHAPQKSDQAARRPSRSLPTTKPRRISRESRGPLKLNVTTLAGYPGEWLLVLSDTDTRKETAERVYGPGPWPEEWIEENWRDGYRITHIAGAGDQWAVAMRTGTGWTKQSYSTPGPLDEIEIHRALSEGIRITAIAGFGNRWVVVFSEGTIYTDQRFLSFTSEDESVTQWIDTHWAKGYHITHVGGAPSDDEHDRWVMIMSKGEKIAEQAYYLHTPYPQRWIRYEREKGFQITAATGHGKWFVVMSRGTRIEHQLCKRSETFPKGLVRSAVLGVG